jgi:hypothetical protein
MCGVDKFGRTGLERAKIASMNARGLHLRGVCGRAVAGQQLPGRRRLTLCKVHSQLQPAAETAGPPGICSRSTAAEFTRQTGKKARRPALDVVQGAQPAAASCGDGRPAGIRGQLLRPLPAAETAGLPGTCSRSTAAEFTRRTGKKARRTALDVVQGA